MAVATSLAQVPLPQARESVCSWFARLALSQGQTPHEVAKHFELSSAHDLDFALTKGQLKGLFESAGVQPRTFALQARVIGHLSRITSAVPRLLMGTGRSARVRYCVGCMTSMGEPYFPIEWRFDCWRMCPIHQCLLRDSCPHCGEALRLLPSLVRAGPKQKGVGMLSRCTACDESLLAGEARLIGPEFDGFRRDILDNGRAVLAALNYGYVQLVGRKRKSSLRELIDLHRRGRIPRGTCVWLS